MGEDITQSMRQEREANMEIGHIYEKKFLEVVTEQIGIREVPHKAVGGDFTEPVIAQTSLETDLWRGFDFILYFPEEKTWVPFDFSLSGDREVQERKKQKAKERGGTTLFIPKWQIDEAKKGAHQDIGTIITSLQDMAVEFVKEKREREKGVKPGRAPQSPTTTIRPSEQPSSA